MREPLFSLFFSAPKWLTTCPNYNIWVLQKSPQSLTDNLIVLLKCFPWQDYEKQYGKKSDVKIGSQARPEDDPQESKHVVVILTYIIIVVLTEISVIYNKLNVYEEAVISVTSPDCLLFHYFLRCYHIWLTSAISRTQLWCKSRTPCILWTLEWLFFRLDPEIKPQQWQLIWCCSRRLQQQWVPSSRHRKLFTGCKGSGAWCWPLPSCGSYDSVELHLHSPMRINGMVLT